MGQAEFIEVPGMREIEDEFLTFNFKFFIPPRAVRPDFMPSYYCLKVTLDRAELTFYCPTE